MYRPLIVTLVLATGLAACAPGGSAPSGTPAAAPEDVVGSWQLVQIGDAAVDAIAAPTLELTETGGVSGSAGCNQFSGTVVVSPDEIRVGPLATTKMACEQPINALEGRYLDALTAARTWSIDAERSLVLEGGERLMYQRADP